MNRFLQKNYSAFIKGGIITIVLSILLSTASFVIIKPVYVSTPVYYIINVFGFVLCWLALSFFIYKFSIYKVLVVFGLLVMIIIVESFIDIPFSIITIPPLVLFWLGMVYFIVPEFFKKYRVAIFSVYGIILCYFLVFRMLPNYVENHHQNFLNFVLIPIPFFAVLWMYEQWRWLQTLQNDKMKAELASLKSQINPHFFFNTLNNLYGLVVEKSEKAPEVVLQLSEMMRYTIYQGKEDLVALKDEISYLENYIELHKIRYQKNVEIIFTHNVASEIKVAPLLFIILLENAFKHGVEKIRKNAFIHLQMETQGTQLSFTIENNFDTSISNPTQGIGLENLKKRLAYSYPNKHELNITEEATYKVYLNLDVS
ncbi:sensor histidine kinase [Kordia sp.]|uniref:sensor histidine kinase n=1 Tax=Kordia sp. TaxID=1965332 RepID=UPI003B58D7F0